MILFLLDIFYLFIYFLSRFQVKLGWHHTNSKLHICLESLYIFPFFFSSFKIICLVYKELTRKILVARNLLLTNVRKGLKGEAIKKKLVVVLRDSLRTCMDIMNPLNLHSWEEENQSQDCDPQETTLRKDSNQVHLF